LRTITFASDSLLVSIEEAAFSKCGFETITVPRAVQTLEPGAFQFCANLTSVNIEENSALATIFQDAFTKEPSGRMIRNLTLPAELQFVDGSALLAVESVTVCHTKYRMSQNFLIYKSGDQNVLIRNFDRSQILRVRAPLTSFGSHSFSECRFRGQLREVQIPAAVREIGKSCFAECVGLTKVVLAKDSLLAIIEEYAFYGTHIESLLLPSSIKAIGGYCFHLCQHLRKLAFLGEPHLVKIEVGTFDGDSLEFEFPQEVASVDPMAFSDFAKVKPNKKFSIGDNIMWKTEDDAELVRCLSRESTVVIKGKIKSLGAYSFLQSVSHYVLFESNSALVRIGHHAFSRSALKAILIPRAVTFLGEGCFEACQSLRQVSIEPDSVMERIESKAFHGTQLGSFVCPPTVTFIGLSAFPKSCAVKWERGACQDRGEHFDVVDEAA
jgi:hypothetical protein